MANINDYLDLMERKQQTEKAQNVHELRTLIPRFIEITHKAQTVLDHAGWQWFADRLETRVQEIEKHRAVKTRQMIFGTEMGHDLELLKIELNVMDAEIAGLKFAAGLIPQAVETGATLRAAAGSADH